MPIKFGTDGWRALIAEDFTFDNVRICAQGTADFLKQFGLASKGLYIGYDTRFASEHFAEAVAEVVTANGIKTTLADRAAPTPSVSYTIASGGYGAGVIITASHNSGRYNGYKFKAGYGGTATIEDMDKLESLIAKVESSGNVKRGTLEDAEKNGLLIRSNPQPDYLAKVSQIVDLGVLKEAGLSVIADPMYGSGLGYFPALLSDGKTNLKEIHGHRNPAFPGMAQPEPLAHNLGELIEAVKSSKADVGLATDGDADRVGVVDEHGNFLTTLETFSLLCFHRLEVLGQRGPLVRSITMSSMIDALGKLYNVPVFVEPVGFKYLGPVMMRENALAAGEESGGYAFSGHIPERDGILSGLFLLEMMAKTGKAVSELRDLLISKVGPHVYHRVDLAYAPDQREVILSRVKNAKPTSLAGLAVREIDSRDGFRFVLENDYWALIRFSGTEPLLRTYAEADSQSSVDKLLKELRHLAGI
ncbi:MAG: phosphoglucomutase/phosphomannomutase family protein [Chloroflexi bacterium]|nr:phosphoglucomutase/phosphomannomutase family protein [Chloroflexota bacterium]